MTFTSAALAIDGARTPGSLQRLGNRASVKQSGIINPGDLKVLPLASPGNGVRIVAGGAVLENRYTSVSKQAYIIENVDEEALGVATGGWPATNPGVARSHLVCVTIGDPQYSTAGHAWLTDANKPANPTAALTFQYVRPFIIQNVPAGTTRVEDLPSPPAYPCYAIARLDLASNWTTITGGSQIVDLRELVNGRQKTVEWNGVTNNDTLSTVDTATFEYFPDNSNASVYIPPWATHFYADAWLQGMLQNATAAVRATFKLGCITDSAMDTAGFKFASDVTGRFPVMIAQKIAIPTARRGTTCSFQIAGVPTTTISQGKLVVDGNSNFHVRMRFIEEAI